MKATRVEIPAALKSDLPQTTFGKILSATPVVMAVVATMLAGLASSEMTKAQYVRSLGAQQQSKAGDQWSFFQAKRVRSAIQENTAELLHNVVNIGAFDSSKFVQTIRAGSTAPGDVKQKILTLAESSDGRLALNLLGKGQVPPFPQSAPMAPAIQAAIEGVENSIPDEPMRALLAKVDNRGIEAALENAREQTKSFDAATRPVNKAVEEMENLLARGNSESAGDNDGSNLLGRNFTAARLRYTANRYEKEARLNQTIANLYELQVRKSNIEADQHHKRSQWFFFGMLAAQAGVIISTFAMAARNRNLLWSLAAGAGVVAIAFAIYVYLYT